MKRGVPWNDEDDNSDGDDASDSGEESSSSSEHSSGSPKIRATNSKGSSKTKTSEVKRKSKGIDFEALRKHGYKGGLSVLRVPPPKEEDKQNWTWSTGKETRVKEAVEETYEERQKTKDALVEAEQLVNARTQKEKNLLSYSQREKKKRDLGQSSRGKNYVEEEKRLLRENGVYSGFDA